MEQLNIFDLFEDMPIYKIPKDKPIRLISLFSGYDSQMLGFKYLGIDVEHYRAVEFDKYAVQSLNDIHNTNFPPLDITKINAQDLGIEDTEHITYLLTYSFPCTDLSLAGKRGGMEKGSNTRSGLLWEVERLLRELKKNNLPQILLMENVPQVLSANGWKDWVLFLERLGYSNYAEILNAKNYGIPQNRERCFMVSILGNYNYKFPKGFKLKYRLKDLLEDEVAEKYYLSEKQISDIKSWNAYEKPLMIMEKIEKSNISPTLTTRTSEYTSSMILIKSDNEPKVLGGIGEKKSNGGTQCYRQDRIYDNNVSICVTKEFQPNYIDNNLRIRKLTPKECFKLMGVKPSDYDKLTVSNSQKCKQAGNSIVTTCLMAIYSQLFDGIDYKKKIDELLEELIKK